MLRFLTTIAVMLWIVVGMVALISFAPITVERTANNAIEDHKSQECNERGTPSVVRSVLCGVGGFIDTYHDDISAVSTVVIAVFTIILGFFTISLARSTRVAANAAHASAIAAERVLEQTSAPYLDVVTTLKAKSIGSSAARQRTTLSTAMYLLNMSFITTGRVPPSSWRSISIVLGPLGGRE